MGRRSGDFLYFGYLFAIFCFFGGAGGGPLAIHPNYVRKVPSQKCARAPTMVGVGWGGLRDFYVILIKQINMFNMIPGCLEDIENLEKSPGLRPTGV